MELNKYKFVSLLLATVLLFSVGLISSAGDVPTSANVTINVPLTGGTFTGSVTVFNVSMDPGYEDQNWSGVDIFVRSASTGNSSDTYLGHGNNVTNDLDLNGTFDSTTIEDATDYIVTFQLVNGTTASNVNATISGITFSNTVPGAATNLLPTSDSDGTVNFSSTVIGRNVTACTLYFSGINPGSSSYAMTHGGDGCSYELASVPEQSYTWYVETSDGVDTADSSTQTTNVDVKTSAGKAVQLIAEGKATSQGGNLLSITDGGLGSIPGGYGMIFVVIAIIVAVVIYKRK